MYGEFNLGGGVKREIIGFPYYSTESEDNVESTVDGFLSRPDKFQVNLKICLLPGLIDIPKLKDSLTSSTLVIELHRDDVFKRSFHPRNVEEYNEMMGPTKAAEVVVDPNAAANKKGAKPAAAAAPPPKKGAPAPTDNALVKTEVTEITDADKFLLGCIHRALAASRQIRPHGTIRYRLEQLLSSSNDLLARFARMRHGGAAIAGDENVVVKVS